MEDCCSIILNDVFDSLSSININSGKEYIQFLNEYKFYIDSNILYDYLIYYSYTNYSNSHKEINCSFAKSKNELDRFAYGILFNLRVHHWRNNDLYGEKVYDVFRYAYKDFNSLYGNTIKEIAENIKSINRPTSRFKSKYPGLYVVYASLDPKKYV